MKIKSTIILLILSMSHVFGQNNKYAVLINSAYNKELNNVHFYNELTRIYNYLIYELNYTEENIFIYSADGTDSGDDYNKNFNYYNSNPDLDGDGDDDITGPSDYQTISNKLIDLDFLDADDFLFLYLTGPVEEIFNGGIFNPYSYYQGIAFWDSDRRNYDALVGPMRNLMPGNLVFIDGRACDGISIDYYEAENRYIVKSSSFHKTFFIFEIMID